MAEVIPILC